MASQLDHLPSDTVNDGIRESGGARLRYLSALRDQLSSGAPGVSLATLRSEISAAIAATQTLGTQMRGSGVAQAAQATVLALRQADAAVRDNVASFMSDFYDKKKFDPYLHFASAEDEEAYRRREEARRRAIEEARAEGTPAGDLRAANLSLDQLHDAGTHGADRSPDYASMEARLRASRDHLAAALKPMERKQATTARDSDTHADPAGGLAPELLASLRSAGVTIPDQEGHGHGITKIAAKASDASLTPP